jgi:hypothetical protein
MVDGIYRETYHQGGLTRQQAVGDYLENGAPVPLDVLERITRAAPDSTILTSLTYARSGLIGLQGSVANEKEYQDFLKKFTELGRTDPRRAWPDNDKFRFELNLTFTGSFGASNKPATQPASAPAIAPATQPSTSPATQPAPSPVTAPAVAPVVPEASPMITPAPSPMFGPAPASQPASQPTGGAA